MCSYSHVVYGQESLQYTYIHMYTRLAMSQFRMNFKTLNKGGIDTDKKYMRDLKGTVSIWNSSSYIIGTCSSAKIYLLLRLRCVCARLSITSNLRSSPFPCYYPFISSADIQSFFTTNHIVLSLAYF